MRFTACIVFAVIAAFGCSSGVVVTHLPPLGQPLLKEDTALTAQARTELDKLSRERKISDYIIGVRDVLNIEVWQKDKPALQRAVTVRADGTVDFPLIGELEVLGKSEKEVSGLVRERISKFIKEPFVSTKVTGVKSKKIYVFGEVNHPGVFPLNEEFRLLDAVLKAGELTEEADLSRGMVIREESVLPVNMYALFQQGDMKNNIYLKNGDKILIPSVKENKIFIFGEVKKPGIVYINRELFLMEAISDSEGLTIDANPNGVRIIRGNIAAPTVYQVNLNELIAGDIRHNIQLKHGDIVFVPAKGIVHWDRFMSRILPNLTDIYLLERTVNP